MVVREHAIKSLRIPIPQTPQPTSTPLNLTCALGCSYFRAFSRKWTGSTCSRLPNINFRTIGKEKIFTFFKPCFLVNFALNSQKNQDKIYFLNAELYGDFKQKEKWQKT
jgi:hypothetical protein